MLESEDLGCLGRVEEFRHLRGPLFDRASLPIIVKLASASSRLMCVSAHSTMVAA
jgi:hypothetical protein